MMIECVGMIGAGKSTVTRQLKDLLVEHGWTVLEPRKAIEQCWQRSLIGKFSARLVPERRHNVVLKGYLRIVNVWFSLVFSLRHPRLVWQVCAAQRQRTIPWWHRCIILQLFFDVAAAYQFLQRRLAAGEAVIFEEGLMHRAINIYAWEPGQLEQDDVVSYFQRLPPSDLLVFVLAPYDVCIARAEARGLPLRLRDKDPLTVQRFMQHAQHIIELAEQVVADSDRAVLNVDNGDSLEDGVRTLRSQLTIRSKCSGSLQQYKALEH